MKSPVPGGDERETSRPFKQSEHLVGGTHAPELAPKREHGSLVDLWGASGASIIKQHHFVTAIGGVSRRRLYAHIRHDTTDDE
jgi:hypothetical protein